MSNSQHVYALSQIDTSQKLQHKRYKSCNKYNSSAKTSTVKELFNLDKAAKDFIDLAASKMDISARSYLKIIKVARTIADLDDKESIEISHISEALQYRHKQ